MPYSASSYSQYALVAKVWAAKRLALGSVTSNIMTSGGAEGDRKEGGEGFSPDKDRPEGLLERRYCIVGVDEAERCPRLSPRVVKIRIKAKACC